MAVGFVVPLALARLATPDDYGRFSFVTAVVAVCSILTAPGLAVAVTHGAARGQDGSMRAAMRDRVRTSGFAVGVVALVGLWVLTFRDHMTGILLLAVAPLVVPTYACDVAGAFLNGQGRYRQMIVALLVAAAVPALAVGGALLLGASILIVTLAYFVSLSVVNVAALAIVQSRYVANDRVDPDVMRFGRRLSWISSLGAVQYYFDRLLIGAMLGFADLAIYSSAKIFQQGLKSIWTAVSQQLFPKLAVCAPSDARRLARRTLFPIWFGFLAVGLVGVLLAPIVVPVVFGSDYAPSVTPARLLMLAVVIGIPGAQLELLFRAVADERRLFTQRIAFTIAELACTGVGAWLYGVTGAAVGMMVAYGSNSVIAYALDRDR